jgi:CRP-like cAMP-binding protein
MRGDFIESILPGTNRQVKPLTTVIYQGEAPRSGFYIKEGVIKAYTLQSTGEERLVAFYGPGDMFPMSWLFEKASNSIFYYESLVNCTLISVTREDIKNIVLKNSNAKDSLLQKLVNDQVSYLIRITALEQSRAAEKILFTLYYLMYVFGKTKDNNQYFVDVKLTHATISSLIGLTRETTATEINKLKKKKILNYSKKYYTIDKKMLESAIGEDNFSELISKN